MATSDMCDVLDHSIIKSTPERLTAASAWHEHIPFAMYLIDILRPHTIVELGTHSGDSYCSFCESVKALKLDSSCYAVDTWIGDSHTGPYGPEVLKDLRSHHDSRYSDFSTLMQSTFDQALTKFGDGTIDLLHIDGFHTYEVVKHDWRNWASKVSEKGIILIHDICERRDNFGVWKLWEELRKEYKTFEFHHGHGLGVIAKGEFNNDEVRRFFLQTLLDTNRTRTIFEVLGQRVELIARLEALNQDLGQLKLLENSLRSLQKEFEERSAWAKELNDECVLARKRMSELQAEFEQRTAWAKSLDAQLLRAREYTAKLQNEFEEKSSWANLLSNQVEDLRAGLAQAERKSYEMQIWGEMIDKQLASVASSPVYKFLAFIGFLPKIKRS